MAEILKSDVERSPRVPLPGFYVMRMKKDPNTGHLVGVATWIPRDQPLPGNRIVPEAPKVPQSSAVDQVERIPVVEVEENRTEPAQPANKKFAERRPVRSTMYDPYDAYEL